jgi:hypothetical protein
LVRDRATPATEARDENVGKRLGRLEKRQAWCSGAAAAVGAIAAYLGNTERSHEQPHSNVISFRTGPAPVPRATTRSTIG